MIEVLLGVMFFCCCFKAAQKNDIVLIAGKGHETYHIVKNKKFYLSDFEEISKF